MPITFFLVEKTGDDVKQPNEAVTAEKVYLILMGILLVVLFLVHFTRPVRDGDLYFHLKYGEYHVENKTAVMDHSVFSWTPATKYYPYCTWAADIFLYALYAFGGWPLLFAFKYACLFLAAITVWLYAKQCGMGASVLTPFVLIVVLLSIYGAAFLKPEILSLLFFVLVAYLYFYVKQGAASSRKQYLFLLYPLVFVFWVNIHNVVFFGLMLLAMIISGEIINFCTNRRCALARKDLVILITSGLLSAAATVINPYGINLHKHFYHLSINGMGKESLDLFTAYQPLVDMLTFVNVEHRLQYWGIMNVIFAILFLLYAIKKRNWDFGLLLPNLFLGLIALQINRTNYYWPAFWAMSVFYLSGSSCLDIPMVLRDLKPLVKKTLVGILLVLSLFLSLRAANHAYFEPTRWSYFGIGHSYLDPVQESAFLKKYKLGKTLFNSYNIGSYLLFDLYPSYKVFIDTRFFPYKKDNFYNTYSDMVDGNTTLAQLESEFNFDVALIEHGFPQIYSFFGAEDWKPAYYGSVGVVFVKGDIHLPIEIEKLDPHRFDDVKNVFQAVEIVRTAQTLNDFKTAAYVISNMEKNVGHQSGFQAHFDRLVLWQMGLQAYAQGDYDKALKVFWRTGFDENNPRVSGLLRQLINKKADTYVKAGKYEIALNLLQPVLARFPDDSDVMYDAAIVAFYLAHREGRPDLVYNGINWKKLLEQFLVKSPEHPFAGNAKTLLAKGGLVEALPLILNSKIKNPRLRTD